MESLGSGSKIVCTLLRMGRSFSPSRVSRLTSHFDLECADLSALSSLRVIATQKRRQVGALQSQRASPASEQSSHTKRKPSIATKAPRKQIKEVSNSSASFFSFVIGRHPPSGLLPPKNREIQG